jgi:hypothetical protein
MYLTLVGCNTISLLVRTSMNAGFSLCLRYMDTLDCYALNDGSLLPQSDG